MGTELLQYIFTGVTIGSIYALIALGFIIIFNSSGVVNLAQGEFVMISGVVAASLVAGGINLWLGVAAAVAVSVAVAGAMWILTIAPIPRASVLTLIFVTLGASIVIRVVAQASFGSQAMSLPSFSQMNPVRVGGASITSQAIWVLVVTLLLLGALYGFFGHTRLGHAMIACSENREGAALVGINIRAVSLASFLLAGALGGLAGVLVAPITSAVFTVGLLFTIKGFTAAILGGFGSVAGAVIGGLVLGLLEAFGSGVIGSGYQDVVALVVLLLVLLFRPGGILGTRVLI